MSKRAHRKRVRGTPTNPNRAIQKRQYMPNKRRKYEFEKGNVL